MLAVVVPQKPPLVVKVKVAVPLYPPGGVQVVFNEVAPLLKVPPTPPSLHVPPVAPPPTEPPNATEVPPWQIALSAEPALAVGFGLTVRLVVLDDDIVALQVDVATCVTVTVFEPAVASNPPVTVNGPVLDEIVSDAVWVPELLAPVTL